MADPEPVDHYTEVLGALRAAGVRYLLIGVGGVNYFTLDRQALFNTEDRDLFLPPDTDNLLRCWRVCEERGLELTSFGELLERPLDDWLARRVVSQQATQRASGRDGVQLDLTFTMQGFTFEELWPERKIFTAHGQQIPVAPLESIIESKRAAGRPKDLLFFVTHEDILRQLLERPGDERSDGT